VLPYSLRVWQPWPGRQQPLSVLLTAGALSLEVSSLLANSRYMNYYREIYYELLTSFMGKGDKVGFFCAEGSPCYYLFALTCSLYDCISLSMPRDWFHLFALTCACYDCISFSMPCDWFSLQAHQFNLLYIKPCANTGDFCLCYACYGWRRLHCRASAHSSWKRAFYMRKQGHVKDGMEKPLLVEQPVEGCLLAFKVFLSYITNYIRTSWKLLVRIHANTVYVWT